MLLGYLITSWLYDNSFGLNSFFQKVLFFNLGKNRVKIIDINSDSLAGHSLLFNLRLEFSNLALEKLSPGVNPAGLEVNRWLDFDL